LAVPSAEASKDAKAIFRFCRQALGHEHFAQAELPEAETPVQQTDAWSCGWHTIARFEEAYREFRGEGPKRLCETVQSLFEGGSGLIKSLILWQKTEEEKASKKGSGRR